MRNRGEVKVDLNPISLYCHTRYGYLPVERLTRTTDKLTLQAADAFSLGLIILELLLGESLFAETHSAAKHIQHLFSLFGSGSMMFLESELKLVGLWPSASIVAKNQRHSLLSFLYKKAPKYHKINQARPRD